MQSYFKKLNPLRIFQKDKTDFAKIIEDNLDSLDIILFNGQDFWFSYLVEWMTDSKFSHIGLVLKSPTFLDPKLTGNYLLESGAETIPDAEDGKVKFGVQITELEPILANYTGQVYYRKLSSEIKNNLGQVLKESSFRAHQLEFEPILKEIHPLISDKPYDDNVWDLIKAQLGIDIGDNQRTNDFFCSALVSFIYDKLGLIPKDIQWDLIEPKNFIPGQKIDQLMKEVGKSQLGSLVRIK